MVGRYRLIDSSLSKLRQDKFLTQQELADLLGVSRSTIKNWEAGKLPASLFSLLQACEILDCSILDLIDAGGGSER